MAIGVTGLFGRASTSIDGTLTTVIGPIVGTRTGSISDSLTSVGDLYPQATLKWNDGVHNYMTYLTGDIPVGAYDPARLSNLGIGHAAIDAGGGYTYFNPAAGHEFSAVAGFTYNFKNPDTQYQNGIDFHVDWGISQFLSKQFFVGLGRIWIPTDHRRLRSESAARRIPVPRLRHRPAGRVAVSGRRHAGISQPERLWRICRREPAVGVECLADVRDLSNGSHQHGDANAPGRDEVAAAIVATNSRSRRVSDGWKSPRAIHLAH